MSERRLAVLLHHLLPCDTVSAAPAASAPAASSLDLPRKKGSAKTVTLGEWQGMVGTEVGVSDWLHLTQDRVDAFSQVTGDPQWIHQRDAKEKGSPFGGPIAHGFLVVALASYLAEGTTPGLQGTKMGVNYGLDSLRFVSPVPVGKRIRMRMTLVCHCDLDPSRARNMSVVCC
jgi:acyl dehydratase